MGRTVDIQFTDSAHKMSGRIKLWFTSWEPYIQYQIDYCGGLVGFAPYVLPSGKVKTWTFTRTAAGVRIRCNGELVADKTIDETNCPGPYSILRLA